MEALEASQMGPTMSNTRSSIHLHPSLSTTQLRKSPIAIIFTFTLQFQHSVGNSAHLAEPLLQREEALYLGGGEEGGGRGGGEEEEEKEGEGEKGKGGERESGRRI